MLISNTQFEQFRRTTFESLHHDLQKKKDTNLTDVTLVSEDLKTVEAHRVILSTASPVLASLLLSHSQVGSRTVLFLSGVPQKHVESLVAYIYLGTTEVEEEEQFMKLLEQFKIKTEHKRTLKFENKFAKLDGCGKQNSKDKQILQSDNRYSCQKEPDVRFGPTEIIEPILPNVIGDNLSNQVQIYVPNDMAFEKFLENRNLAKLKPEIMCTYCNTKVVRSTFQVHLTNTHAESKTPCKNCGKQILKAHLRWHVKMAHETVQPTKICGIEECQFEYTTPKHLNSHKQKIHADYFKCDQCTYQTWSNDKLKDHLREKHGAVKYQCEYCIRSFAIKRSFMRHISVVHDGKRFDCASCEYKAANPYNLQVHIEAIHLKKRAQCHVCSFTCSQRAKLRVHMKEKHQE